MHMLQSWPPLGRIVLAGVLAAFGFARADAQTFQHIEVTIKDFTFVTKQIPLHLGAPTVISIRNEDNERHDFGSSMFDGTPTQVSSGSVISYGKGIGGVFLESKGEAEIRFTIDRSGRHQFKCSIHPNMKGELLLLSVEAV
jgi:plastocyanin